MKVMVFYALPHGLDKHNTAVSRCLAGGVRLVWRCMCVATTMWRAEPSRGFSF